MMPRTHLLGGMVVIAMLSFFVEGITLLETMLGGAVAVAIDLDHVLMYFGKYKILSLEKTWNACIKHRKLGKKPLHDSRGMLLAFLVALALLFYRPVLGAVVIVALASHFALDHTKVEAIACERFRVWHMIYPITIGELILDVFMLDILVILLMAGGLA